MKMLDYVQLAHVRMGENLERSSELVAQLVDIFQSGSFDALRIVASGSSRHAADCARDYLQGAHDIHEASLALQQAVRSVYLEAAAKDPALRGVDCSDPAGAMDSPEGIFAKICAQLAPILEADAEVQGL